MTTLLEYKGYVGKVEVDLDANILHGEVMYLRDVVTFQGKTVDDIRQAFQDSIEDYLEFCESEGEEPEKPFSGKFLVRLTAEQHKLRNVCWEQSKCLGIRTSSSRCGKGAQRTRNID